MLNIPSFFKLLLSCFLHAYLLLRLTRLLLYGTFSKLHYNSADAVLLVKLSLATDTPPPLPLRTLWFPNSMYAGTDGFITSARPPRRLASGYFGATPRLRASERPWRSSGLFRSGGGRTDQGRKAVVGGVGWGTVVVSAAAGRGRRLEGLRMITVLQCTITSPLSHM